MSDLEQDIQTVRETLPSCPSHLRSYRLDYCPECVRYHAAEVAFSRVLESLCRCGGSCGCKAGDELPWVH